MKKYFVIAISFILLSSFDLPKGWFIAGSHPDSYDIGVENNSGMNKTKGATIRSNTKGIKGFGTLMQNCSPKSFVGHKIRMSGYMRSENVNDWAGFWFRVDGSPGQRPLAFDNMENRAVKGDTEWKKYEIVLHVPHGARNIAYGALLSGNGQICFDDLKIEKMTDQASDTAQSEISPANLPVNLDFER